MALTDNPMSLIVTENVTISTNLEQEIIGDPEVLLYYVSYTSKSRARLGAISGVKGSNSSSDISFTNNLVGDIDAPNINVDDGDITEVTCHKHVGDDTTLLVSIPEMSSGSSLNNWYDTSSYSKLTTDTAYSAVLKAAPYSAYLDRWFYLPDAATGKIAVIDTNSNFMQVYQIEVPSGFNTAYSYMCMDMKVVDSYLYVLHTQNVNTWTYGVSYVSRYRINPRSGNLVYMSSVELGCLGGCKMCIHDNKIYVGCAGGNRDVASSDNHGVVMIDLDNFTTDTMYATSPRNNVVDMCMTDDGTLYVLSGLMTRNTDQCWTGLTISRKLPEESELVTKYLGSDTETALFTNKPRLYVEGRNKRLWLFRGRIIYLWVNENSMSSDTTTADKSYVAVTIGGTLTSSVVDILPV